MSKYEPTVNDLLRIVAHQNDALKYLKQTLQEVNVGAQDTLNFEKFVERQEQSDTQIKNLLRKMQDHE